jgi:5-methylcytosine-specific restriction endonuclease McrA
VSARVCACGCGRSLDGRRANALYVDGACRVRCHRAGRTVRERREMVQAIRLATGCTDCGKQGPVEELHFHHLDPTTKSFNVGDGRSRSRSAVLAEIAKCAVLCRDCHAAVHRRLDLEPVTLAGLPTRPGAGV